MSYDSEIPKFSSLPTWRKALNIAIWVALISLLAVMFVAISNSFDELPKADVNSDGTVNIRDMSLVLSHWDGSNTDADINGDGVVGVADLDLVESQWGSLEENLGEESPRAVLVTIADCKLQAAKPHTWSADC